MFRFPLFILALILGFATGCGKKAAPEAAPENPAPAPGAKAEPTSGRDKLLAGLKSTKQEARLYSIEELSWLAEDDPAVLPALVELLRDKTTAGPGRTHADRVNSTREAAALAIMQCTGGEEVMKEKGLAVLREGLGDPSPAVREHTAYTVGLLGPVAKSLAPDVQKLCTDPDATVRAAAFDALRATGGAEPIELAKLLLHKEEGAARLAAELIPLVPAMPAEGVAPLGEALAGGNPAISFAAAKGLALAGPKAAPAVPQLVAAIKASYPEEFDPETARLDGPEAAFWNALAKVGEAAVAPTAKLLDHKNPMARWLAARTLGEIGTPAKGAAGQLKKALGDANALVAVEAAVTLAKLGESKAESVALMKRALDSPQGGAAAIAIQGVPRMGDAGKELIPLALAKVGDANPYTRAAAVWLVGQLPPAEAARYAAEVGRRATDEEAEIRRTAGRVLARLGPDGAPSAGALGDALAKETESDIRGLFVEALLAMKGGAKPAVPALLPLIANRDMTVPVRAKVVAAVADADPASPEVAAALVKAAGDPDPTIRAAAARAIGHLNPLPPDALSTLVKLAKGDPKMPPRFAAVRGMATAGPRAKSAKAELDALTASQLPGLGLWAKVALAAIGGDVKKAAPDIRAGLKDRSLQVRAAAAEGLLLIGPTEADLPVLLKLLNDRDAATKVACAEAIGQLGPVAKDAAPQLRRMLDDRDSEVRTAAAEALERIEAR